MPLGSLTKRLRRSRIKRDDESRDSIHSSPSHSDPKPSEGSHAQTNAPTPIVHAESTPVQMPVPVLAGFQVPDVSIETATPSRVDSETGADTDTDTVEEPIQELSLLGHEIDRRYNAPKTRDISSPSRVEELTHIHVNPALKEIDIKNAFESGIERFSDSIPMLKKALSEVSKIHPVVTVAVLAFEAVIALEITRRENDRRVTVLFVEMKAVMSVITNFKDLRSNDIGQDGVMLSVRLRELAEGTAEDIKQCANLCDAFLKSRLLPRVLKGPLWAERFAASMEQFARRKEAYSLALAMHTASTVTKMAIDVRTINYKIELMHAFFEKYMTATERNLVAEVEKEGGATKVRQDDATLRRLMGTTATKEPVAGTHAREDRSKGHQPEAAPINRKRTQVSKPDATAGGSDRTFGLDDLKRELREDLDDTIERNFAVFVKKYDFQAQIMSDRIIHAVEAAVGSGSHSRIKNADLQKLWKEMNWTGVVKGRILVHALREHYGQDEFVPASPTASEILVNDKWALDYLNIAWLHPIMEAIDDDTSGYISVSEVNRFMQRLPPELGWSLPHWLAYWAIGWRCATTKYLDEIQTLIYDFHQALPNVLAINRPAIDAYLSRITPAWTLLAGFDRWDDQYMCDRFSAYTSWEEARLKANLEKFNYRIDAYDTLKLVLGSSRIERCIVPLVCLLLRNDLRKVKAAKTFILAEDEFPSSETSMSTIDNALESRCEELQETFTQRKLDPKAELKRFASGLLSHFARETNPIPHEWWESSGASIDYFYSTATYRDAYPDPETDITSIGTLSEVPLDTSVYDAVERETEDDLTSDPAVNAIVGTWNGFLYETTIYPTRPMTTLSFHAAPPRPQSDEVTGHGFLGEGTDFEGSEYSVTGTCTASQDGIEVEWCMEYDGDVTLYFVGRILDEFTLAGNQRYDKDVPGDAYIILKKAPAEYLCYRPPPFELHSQPYPLEIDYNVTPENRARALWRYALNAVQHDVRRKWWTWSYFEERRHVRRLWFEMRTGPQRTTGDYLLREMHNLTTTADARVYHSITERANRTCDRYDDLTCEAWGCRRALSITTVACLDCLVESNFRYMIAFCDDPYCYYSDAAVNLPIEGGRPHDATHERIKYRTVMLSPYWASAHARALNCLQEARMALQIAESAQRKRSVTSLRSGELDTAISERIHRVASNASEGSIARESQGAHSPPPLQSPPPEEEDSQRPQGGGVGVQHSEDESESLLPVAMPQAVAAASRWSLRSLLSNPWGAAAREAAASAADASSTLAASLAPGPEPQAAGTTATHAPAASHSPSLPEETQADPADTQSVQSHLKAPDPEPDVELDNSAEPEAVDHALSDAPSSYATARTSIAPSSPAWSDIGPPRLPQCQVCSTVVSWGSWYCLQCRDFLCVECDKLRLIRCVECAKPFPQPAWYYGMGPLDDFRCDVCSGTRRSSTQTPGGHVHTHPLVLCKPLSFAHPDSRPPSPVSHQRPNPDEASSSSVAERLAAVEGRVAQVDALQSQFGQVGARLEQLDVLQEQMAQIREMMTALLQQQR